MWEIECEETHKKNTTQIFELMMTMMMIYTCPLSIFDKLVHNGTLSRIPSTSRSSYLAPFSFSPLLTQTWSFHCIFSCFYGSLIDFKESQNGKVRFFFFLSLSFAMGKQMEWNECCVCVWEREISKGKMQGYSYQHQHSWLW